LDDEHVLAAHVFVDLDEGFTVGEGFDGSSAHLDPDVSTDGPGEGFVCGAAKNLHKPVTINGSNEKATHTGGSERKS